MLSVLIIVRLGRGDRTDRKMFATTEGNNGFRVVPNLSGLGLFSRPFRPGPVHFHGRGKILFLDENYKKQKKNKQIYTCVCVCVSDDWRVLAGENL